VNGVPTGAGRTRFARDELVPERELLVHTPAVFVRVANKGVTGYGTWKKVRKIGDRGECWRERIGELNAETQSAQRGRVRGGSAGLASIHNDPC
jgi:hypothetical protein